MSARRALRTGGLWFDGVDDYVDCGNAPSLNTFSSITVTVLAKQMRWTGGLDAWVLDKDFTGYRIWGQDRHRAMFRSPTQNWQAVDGGSVPELNRWYHLTAVYDGDALMLRLYRDGVLVAQSASPEKLNFGFYGIPLRLGRHSVESRFYPVVIGYVAIHNRALTEDEIKAIHERGELIRDGLVLHLDFTEYEGNVAYDKSGCGNHATIYGARWVVKKALRVLPKAR